MSSTDGEWPPDIIRSVITFCVLVVLLVVIVLARPAWPIIRWLDARWRKRLDERWRMYRIGRLVGRRQGRATR